MLFVTRWFGVTGSASERSAAREQGEIAQIAERSRLMQANAAASQHRPLGRGTHMKGVCVRGRFEVLDQNTGRDPALAARLAKGLFARPGIYPAVVRFGNSDPRSQSDFKADVRSLSFSVDLNGAGRQDFSMQNARTLPINDSSSFVPVFKLLTATSPAACLWSLAFKDKLRVLRSMTLAQMQLHQTIRPYQRLRYWSTVPFRHGPHDVVMYSATPSAGNPAQPLDRHDPNGLQRELIRHVQEDAAMSTFDVAVQFLDVDRMTYWGKLRDASFWIENASIRWNETQAPFHTVGRLTLVAKSHLRQEEADAVYFDVTGHSTEDSTPLGSVNRARWSAEVASRHARLARDAHNG